MNVFQKFSSVFLFLGFFPLISCKPPNDFSSQVQVAVFGFGQGDAVKSRDPIIYETESMQICRPGPVDLEKIESLLKKQAQKQNPRNINRGSNPSDKDSDVLELLNITPTETGGTGTEDGNVTENQERNKAIKTDVRKYWAKFGLRIFNGNPEYNLIVTDITFRANAQYRKQNLQHTVNISSGYCETPGFLYIVPPGSQIEYTPYSSNSLANLTLYVSGFPVVDTTTQSDPASPSAGEIAGASSSGPPPSLLPSRCPIIIPRYNGIISLNGYFITPRGSRDGIWPFHKDIPFSTISSRPECS